MSDKDEEWERWSRKGLDLPERSWVSRRKKGE